MLKALLEPKVQLEHKALLVLKVYKAYKVHKETLVPKERKAYKAFKVLKAYLVFKVRKEPKDHGRGRQVEGPEVKGKRVVVVEDTSTTGGSPLTG